MGKSIVIREEKYFNEFKNGENFDQNLNDFTNNFTGSVMEKQKVRFVIDVNWGFDASTSNGVSSNPFLGSITKQSGSFIDDGFAVGGRGVMLFSWTGSGNSFHFQISAINNNTMFVTQIFGQPQPDSATNSFNNTTVSIVGLDDLTSLVWNFGLVENSDIFNPRNLITNSDQSYYGTGINSTTWTNFQSLGSNKDWVSGSLRVRKIDNPIGFLPSTNQRFEIEHELVIPFYAEGDDFIQQPNYLDGLNSLKYTFQAGFRTVLSNQNTEKSFTYDSSLGSVAYYDENFNGFNNVFSVSDVQFQEATTLNNADGIITSGRTKVTVKVDRSDGFFSNFSRYGVYVGYQAEELDYTNTPNSNFLENFIYDRELGVVGSTTNGQVFLYKVNASVISNQLIITFEVEYTPQQKLFLSQKLANGDARFIIAVSVGDFNLGNGNSNRVMLLASTGSYDFNADIPNLVVNNNLGFYTYKDVIGVDSPKSSIEQWIEDGFIAKGSFDLDLNKEAYINSLEFKLIAHNSTTGRFFDLDSYSVNVASSPIVNGVQQINLNTDRGYNLANGNNFNNVIITTGTNSLGFQTYDFEIGQKISWQEWINNQGADTVFYDNNKVNNNLNYNASNYSFKNGYAIKYALFMNVLGKSDEGVKGDTNYLIVSPNLVIHDYDKDNNLTPVWSGLIETFNPANSTNLNGAILSGNNDTLMRVTWTNSFVFITSVADLNAIHRIEETGQNGYSIDENGDNRQNPNNNRLINKNTFTEVDIYLDNNNHVVTECLIKGSALNPNTQYNLSAKLWNVSPIDLNGKVMSPSNEAKITSGTITEKTLAI